MRTLTDEQIKKTAQSLIDAKPEDPEIYGRGTNFTAWLTEVELFIDSLDNATLSRALRSSLDEAGLQKRLIQESQERSGLLRWAETYGWQTEGAVSTFTATIRAIDNALLTELSVRIAAEIYNDVLAESDRLIAEKRLPCAAILARIGLENGLHRLAARHNVQLAPKEKASTINLKLRQANVPGYTLSTQQSVDGLLAIGNAFAHSTAEVAKYTEADVTKMIADIRHFLRQHGV